jgi:para-nitrobenzyl esterase
VFRFALVPAVALLAASCANPGSDMPSAPRSSSPPVVETRAGKLQGRAEGTLNVFQGIQYAAAPVGESRWKPPAPAAAWSGVREATAYGPACVQPTRKVASIYANDIGKTSEDCLTLNVWAPAGADAAPVFVWIHGGALAYGSSRESYYDGARMAGRGLVVVTINYRLGVFGYLAHPALGAESALGISGNYGLQDQIAALRWIQANIGAFGGDPANVTIAGESAGGLSVMYLMAAPDARGLFSKAIAQSAYMISMPTLKEAKSGEFAAEQIGAFLAAKLQAADIAGMRAMDAQALADAAAGAGYSPFGNIDGHTLKAQLIEVFERGEQAPVPLLAGFNSGEIRSLLFLAPPAPATSEAYESVVRDRYLDLADEFLRIYPSADMKESILATTRDALYGWTAEALVKHQTALGQPAYLYYFDHGYPAADDAGLHGFHAGEMPYMFGTFDHTPPLWPKNPATPAEHAYADAMLDYWTSFARTGQPRAAKAPDWPAYGTSRDYMWFSESPQPANHLLPGMFELHDEAVRRRRTSGVLPWNRNVGVISPPLPRAAAAGQ